jgi:quercetin dioxygenase-like cupin family protein
MATKHASSGEVIDLRPLGAPISDAQSTTLLRDEQHKVMRLVMPTGKELHDHAVDGPITMQCLEGEIEVAAHVHCNTMRGGDLMYLASRVPHSLRATEDASVLVTIVVEKPAS